MTNTRTSDKRKIAEKQKAVGHAVKDIKGWEVTEDVVLSMFSFAKYLMWKDLAERSEQLRENPVVRHLLDTPRDAYPPGTPFPQVRELDQHFPPEQVFCPLPADSSQLSAVLAASQGKDFVLIGPPGTGKSQTIANLIAQSLAQGRRVLFVSEKIAALDVVYRRLREIGLGEFCLELHSSKARKLDVLAQLQSAWSSSGQADAEQWRAEADKLKHLRDALNVYVERLHQRRRNGLGVGYRRFSCSTPSSAKTATRSTRLSVSLPGPALILMRFRSLSRRFSASGSPGSPHAARVFEIACSASVKLPLLPANSNRRRRSVEGWG